jgi:uncharacterized protein (DUF983 family)
MADSESVPAANAALEKEATLTLTGAMTRGLRGRCPRCGEGPLFRSPLKVAENCPVCGEDYTPQRADDFPAYIVIFIVGHIVVPLAVAVEQAFSPAYWVHLALWLPLAIILCIALLQPVKGAIVALQWFTGMHDFREAKERREKGTG